jgi:hypothetical protein
VPIGMSVDRAVEASRIDEGLQQQQWHSRNAPTSPQPSGVRSRPARAGRGSRRRARAGSETDHCSRPDVGAHTDGETPTRSRCHAPHTSRPRRRNSAGPATARPRWRYAAGCGQSSAALPGGDGLPSGPSSAPLRARQQVVGGSFGGSTATSRTGGCRGALYPRRQEMFGIKGNCLSTRRILVWAVSPWPGGAGTRLCKSTHVNLTRRDWPACVGTGVPEPMHRCIPRFGG